MKITIKDVAKACNVNISTVSRVINKDSRISEETALKVHQAINELGYKPLRKRSKSNRAIILAVPNTNVYTLGETISYLSSSLSQKGFDLQLVNLLGNRELTPDDASDLIKRRPAGIILYGCSVSRDTAEVFIKNNVPAIVRHGVSQDLISVNVNNYNGIQVGTKFLLNRGYTKIGFIGWDPEDHNLKTRYTSFSNALNEKGLNPTYYISGTLDAQGGYHATKRMLEVYNPEAILYAADILAYGGIEYLRKQRINYPKDLGIMGFDDAMLSRSLGLTSLYEHIEETAELVTSNLLEMIETNTFLEPKEINLTPTLTDRGSA